MNDLNIACVANLKLMRALGRGHSAGELGFRTTALGAPIAAALSGGYLIGLDAEAIAHSAGIAASSLPAGLLAAMSPVNGSYSSDKDTAVGLSAQHAVQSVLLAETGATGPTAPLTGHRGWLPSYGFDTDLPDALNQPPPALALDAYALKRYPANFGCQAAIRAALELRRQTAFGDIAAVEIRVKSSSAKSLSTKSIVNHLAARFSLPYAVASTLVRGHCTLADFEPEALTDPAVLTLIDRCTIIGDPDLEAVHHERGIFPGHVALHRQDGKTMMAGFDGPWDGATDADKSTALAEKSSDLLGDVAQPMMALLQRIGGPDGTKALHSGLSMLSIEGAVAPERAI